MSEKNDGANREAKRSARERLLVERERQKKKDKLRRTLVVGGAVVGVLGLAAVVGVIAANSGKSGKSTKAGPVTAPSGATGKDALAIQTGRPEAPSTLTVWEDFRCPACKSFETNYRDTVHELEAKGLLKVDYHLVTLIDGNMGGSGSLKGANAAACAQDAGKFPAYHDVLFQNQPQEVDDAYGSNAKLLELAGKVDGLVTPEFRACVEDGTHNSWVAKSFAAFQAGKFRGTPAVLLDGKDIFADQAHPITPQKLKEQVEAKAKAKGSGGAGASPSAPASRAGLPSAAASASPASRAKGSALSGSSGSSGSSSTGSSGKNPSGTRTGGSPGSSAGSAPGASPALPKGVADD